jgi:hypothetical protein
MTTKTVSGSGHPGPDLFHHKDRGDCFDYLMMMPYIMIPPDGLEAFWIYTDTHAGYVVSFTFVLLLN